MKRNSMLTALRSRFKVRIGPGLLLAGILALGLFFSGRLTAPVESKQNNGVLAYEADAAGIMRPVAPLTPPAEKPMPGRLWKPEISELQNAPLKPDLSEQQISTIKKLSARWQVRREELMAAMGQSTSGLKPVENRDGKTHLTRAALVTGLNDYSQLSREYDSLRRLTLEQGLMQLNPAQRQSWERYLAMKTGQVVEAAR